MMAFVTKTPTIYVLCAHDRQFKTVMKSLGWNQNPVRHHIQRVDDHKSLASLSTEKGKSFIYPLSGWQKNPDADRIQQVLTVKKIDEVSTSFVRDMIDQGFLDGENGSYDGLDLADLQAMNHKFGGNEPPTPQQIADLQIEEALRDLERKSWGDF